MAFMWLSVATELEFFLNLGNGHNKLTNATRFEDEIYFVLAKLGLGDSYCFVSV